MTRLASDIGAGLAPARAARPLRGGEQIHVVGAGGSGASAAALLAAGAGATITGCDAGGPSSYTPALAEAGIELAWSHDPAHVRTAGGRSVDRLAVSKALTAVAPDHPELAAAHAAGIPTEPWQQLVADVVATTGQSLISVAGTHGKSTTAGWLVHLLVGAGGDPSAYVGALLDAELTGALPATARVGRGRWLVAEADEYAGNFDVFRPEIALLLNAEWDHPDVFADEQAVIAAFTGWLERAAENDRRPILVANFDDSGVRRVLTALGASWPGRVVGFGLDAADADIRGQIESVEHTTTRLRLTRNGTTELGVEVNLAGRHNVANALAVAATAFALDLPDAALASSLAGYRGVARRMEVRGDVCGIVVIDDYGHHPTAIARTLEATRQAYPGRRLWAVYEPLTAHRTAAMLDAFADVLATADQALVIDVWAGRDPDPTIVSAADLARATEARSGRTVLAPGSPEASATALAGLVQSGDVVLVMGGGRSYVTAQHLVEQLGDRRLDF